MIIFTETTDAVIAIKMCSETYGDLTPSNTSCVGAAKFAP